MNWDYALLPSTEKDTEGESSALCLIALTLAGNLSYTVAESFLCWY